MGKRLLALLVAFLSVLAVQAQTDKTDSATLVRAEYFYDTDPGYGQATIINNVTEGDNALSLSVSGLSPGAHTLYVRSQASNGVWSVTQAHPILLTGKPASQLVRLEYFFDTDPGYGKGVPVSSISTGESVLPLSINNVAPGVHQLSLRAQDNMGVWSQVASSTFFISSPQTANAVRIEYFFDTDPGYGRATAITPSQDEEATYALSLDHLSMGAHMLYLRVQDNHGRWSAVQQHPIYVLSNLPDVVAVEYFFDDNDPGEGLATAVALPNMKMEPYAFEANTTGLAPGEHHLMVRLQKNNGFWTLYDAATFTVEGGAEPEAYAVLTDHDEVLTDPETGDVTQGKTLTFYYDDQKEVRNGMDIGPFRMEYVDTIKVVNSGWFSQRESITNVVFDASFASDTTVISTAYWFYGCCKLSQIEGMENLKTDNVRSMTYMFHGCSGLTSLDVSNFKTDNVTDMFCMFDGCSGLTTLDVSGFKTDNVTSMYSMFRNCSGLTSLDVSNFKTDNVTDMNQMFYKCSSLTSLDVSGFTTDNVTHMGSMFQGCSALTSLDVSGFKTDNVTNMGSMFQGCSGLTSLDVSGFKTDNVIFILGMFSGCSGLTSLDVSGFKTDNVVSMSEMFSGCSGLTSLDVSGFNTANVTSFGSMFRGCSSLTSLDVSNFNTANVEFMSYMFCDCSSLTSLDVSGFNTANVMMLPSMFSGCSGLTSLDVSGFNTDNVTNMGAMFRGCTSLTSLDVSGFKTDNVTNIHFMFRDCSGLTMLDVSGFNTVNVTSMIGMFFGCSELNTIYAGSGWSTEAVTDGQNMFTRCTKLVGGRGTTYDENHIDHTYAHIDGGPSNPGYFTDKNAVPEIAEAYAALSDNNTVLTFYYDDQKEARNGMNIGPFRYVWDDSSYQYVISGRDWTDQVGQITKVVFDSSFAQNTTLTSTAWWFDGCSNLAEIEGIGNLKTDNVTSMYSMFSGCSSLTSLDVSGFTTDQVKDMSGMFSGCSGLTSIDVSHFKTDNVTDMSFMFEKCSGLTTIDLGNFRTEKLTNLNGMFSDCSQLVSINMSGFAIDRAGYAYMFTNCSSLAAIQAGGANIPDEQYAEIGNPNLLVYVNEASQAPQNVQNVVVRDFASTIILTDEAGTSGNNNFYVPRSFTAEMISYTHEYRQQTVNGVSRGWESIVLPFTVQTIVNERNGVIAPFGNSSSDMHFWLRQLSSDGIIRATQIEANRAYLISMPNNEDEYAAKYNQNGRVTFSSENALVPATVIEGVEGQIPGGEMVTLMPNFLKKDASDNLYALNVGEERLYNGTNYPEGSVFERGYRGIRPFEAFTIHHGNSPAPQFISISDMTDGGNVTGIDATLVNSEEVNSEKWYSVNGQKLQKKPTQKGVYLHNGRKVIVR